MSKELEILDKKVNDCIEGLRKDLLEAARKEDYDEISSIHLQLDMCYMFGEWIEKAID